MPSSRQIASIALAVPLLVTACAVEPHPAPARDATATVPDEAAAALSRIKDADREQLAVSEEDGRFLRALVAIRGARAVLEIGGASGYSGIWLGLGARETGGQVTSIEYDPARAAEALGHIEAAGLGDIVRVVPGDAFQEIPRVPGTFDLVFLDAWKRDYRRFFDLVYPRLAPGGVFVAHNVVNKRSEMEDFLEVIQAHPQLFTTIVSPSHEGMSVSYRLR
jgi:predicted O-methyltransferase YrrM